MAMSEPSAAWISMLSSGVSSIFEPSRWFWKRTPSSVILRSLASDQTWKPPESVRNRLLPGGETVQAAHFADQLVAGPQPQVVGVAEDDLRSELLDFGRMQGLDRALGAHRHENRGLHRAMRQTSRPLRAEVAESVDRTEKDTERAARDNRKVPDGQAYADGCKKECDKEKKEDTILAGKCEKKKGDCDKDEEALLAGKCKKECDEEKDEGTLLAGKCEKKKGDCDKDEDPPRRQVQERVR
jgi:hypothetical protein